MDINDLKEKDPIAVLESFREKEKNTPKSMEVLFQNAEKLFGTRRYEVEIFEKYASDIFNRNQFKPNTIREIGKLVTFEYRPVGFSNLPYFDIRPLVFILRVPSNQQLIGMNLHYLPPNHRIMAYYGMYQLITDKKFGEDARIRLYYDMLKNQKRFARNVACIRQYKTQRIRSKVYEVNPKYWESSLVVPSQRFLRKREASVYMDMNKKIRKLLGTTNANQSEN